MPVIGITGGIATGKTALCRFLREQLPAADFFDADKSARDLTDHDAEVQQLISETFGPQIYSSGHLNRAALRTIVFADPEKRRALEQILHPPIRRQWSLEAKEARNASDFFFADIPLLYETDGNTLCDRVVVVACAYEIQLARLMKRTSLDRLIAGQMIAAQMPLTEKIGRADHVVWNNGDRTALAAQAKLLAAFWRKIG
jgi:dephospho-CoA kinase